MFWLWLGLAFLAGVVIGVVLLAIAASNVGPFN
jgi:hypothetical protein